MNITENNDDGDEQNDRFAIRDGKLVETDDERPEFSKMNFREDKE